MNDEPDHHTAAGANVRRNKMSGSETRALLSGAIHADEDHPKGYRFYFDRGFVGEIRFPPHGECILQNVAQQRVKSSVLCPDISIIEKSMFVEANNVLHQEILKIFPELQILLSGPPPVLANLYPSYFGSAKFALNVECVMRPINAIKAMKLAHSRGSSLILCGQPLLIAQFAHLVRDSDFIPRVIVLMLGAMNALQALSIISFRPCHHATIFTFSTPMAPLNRHFPC